MLIKSSHSVDGFDSKKISLSSLKKVTLSDRNALIEYLINDADISDPSINEVPYVGISFLFMPDFQGFAGRIANEISAAQVGDKSVEEALAAAQEIALESVTKSGLKN